jgi:shikimate kinase
MSLSLIGPRGVGKTAVGKKLAWMLRLDYVSIDAAIVEAEGRSVREIVETEGWVRFRLLEESLLARAALVPGRLLDTGGGVVEIPGNRALLARYGRVIWLTAPVAELVARTSGSGDRPPLTDLTDEEEEMAEVLMRREPLYREIADFSVHTAGKTVAEVCEEIVTWLRALQYGS